MGQNYPLILFLFSCMFAKCAPDLTVYSHIYVISCCGWVYVSVGEASSSHRKLLQLLPFYLLSKTESGKISLWVNPPPNYKEQADIRQRKILGREDLKLLHGFSRTKRMNGADVS